VIGSDRCETHKEVSAIQSYNSFSCSSITSAIMAHINLHFSDPAARAIGNSVLTPFVIASLSPPRPNWLLTICKRLRSNGEAATLQAIAAFHCRQQSDLWTIKTVNGLWDAKHRPQEIGKRHRINPVLGILELQSAALFFLYQSQPRI